MVTNFAVVNSIAMVAVSAWRKFFITDNITDCP